MPELNLMIWGVRGMKGKEENLFGLKEFEDKNEDIFTEIGVAPFWEGAKDGTWAANFFKNGTPPFCNLQTQKPRRNPLLIAFWRSKKGQRPCVVSFLAVEKHHSPLSRCTYLLYLAGEGYLLGEVWFGRRWTNRRIASPGARPQSIRTSGRVCVPGWWWSKGTLKAGIFWGFGPSKVFLVDKPGQC